MAISKRDRTHFARLGNFKALSHAKQSAEHLALPLAERLEKSWALFEAFRASTSPRRDTRGPSAFYARARALGLIRN